MNTPYHISFNQFNLREEQFDHVSNLHGTMHTYRVMSHVLLLGMRTGALSEASNAFFAAYVHDMARKHDGYCTQHGPDAANYKLPEYISLFTENGVSAADIPVIGKAVAYHSLGKELSRNDPDWLTVALLKDADALDRIRLGENGLNPAYLRIPESHLMIEHARSLYFLTFNSPVDDFETVLKLALSINQ
ncbi:HD domain-containing protein [Lentimicrobium sp.]|uniref:HD domain-containing protein n=1 Tax=Lentimicrobium sp. TaxID=2034841 RepID=UPI002C76485B|nr:HD domain-containing protein [Lentimicrobium sp.]HRW70101.1 HD domain-containing protein [Lentimicrobium sp.]